MTYPVAYADRPRDAHWRPDTVTWDEILGWMAKPARRKECGNYILATLLETEKVHAGADEPCRDIHRDNRSIGRRSAVIALDIDTPQDGFEAAVELMLDGHTYAMHTTHSSTPSEPRYRLLVQTDRDMAPDEYVEAATALAARIGLEHFDTGSFQAARFMFKPATRKPEWYEWSHSEGQPVDVQELVAEFDRSLSDAPAPKPGKNKRDPFAIDGVVGSFNRAYEDLDELIREYALPYEPVSEDRYKLTGAATEAGMGPVSGARGLFYSHHAGDPAYGQTCSAFDLARLHIYGEQDEAAKSGTPINKLPSYIAMVSLATKDRRVIQESLKEAEAAFGRVEDDSDPDDVSWRADLLEINNQGRLKDEVNNWDVIRRKDPVFTSLYFNVLTMSPEVNGDLPWRKVTPLSRTFDGIDHAELRDYIERIYKYRASKEQVDHLVMTAAGRRRVSPVHDYLESLVWDGKPRVETCLPGAQDNRYNRLVARKVLAAAVARVYEPGLKWDHTLVLQGGEGLGKSTWIERMATVGVPERHTYHYSLANITSKDTLLAMHMSWIVVADEGNSLRKADSDALKEFLTRTQDVFRAPYDRDTVVHPRQCVIWSTTNDEIFLRRQDGNRRFWMVKCLEKIDFDAMTPDYVDQLWAEAVHIYKSGERLHLTEDEALLAALERDPFVEEDSNAGVIEDFLSMAVPDDWWDMSPEARIQWKSDRAHGFASGGSLIQDQTCSRQLWHEALNQRIPPRRTDLLEIVQSLRHLGWTSIGTGHFPGYGTQTIFIRQEDLL